MTLLLRLTVVVLVVLKASIRVVYGANRVTRVHHGVLVAAPVKRAFRVIGPIVVHPSLIMRGGSLTQIFSSVLFFLPADGLLVQ